MPFYVGMCVVYKAVDDDDVVVNDIQNNLVYHHVLKFLYFKQSLE